MPIKSLNFVLLLPALAACAAAPAREGSSRIFLSQDTPPANCRWLSEVRGAQGNFWTAEFTSDAELIAGARNRLRNAAYELGANYVRIETESFSQNTAAGSLGGTYSAVVIGNAYACEQSDLPRGPETPS